MTGRGHSIIALAAALVAALALCGCDIPAAGKPVAFAEQGTEAAAQAGVAADGEGEGAAPEGFDAAADMGEGTVVLYCENHLGATIESVSLRKTDEDAWDAQTTYDKLSVPNGSGFVLRMDAGAHDLYDIRFEGTDGTSFVIIACSPAALRQDCLPSGVFRICYDGGITYFAYTDALGLAVDTQASSRENLAALHARLEEGGETYTFTERDLEGVEAGQETENCLD